jgi:hypothetical protein
MTDRVSQVVVGHGKRAKTWTVREVWPDDPDPRAWERAESALVRLLLPKALELIARQKEAENAREAADLCGLRAGPGARVDPAADAGCAAPVSDRLLWT